MKKNIFCGLILCAAVFLPQITGAAMAQNGYKQPELPIVRIVDSPNPAQICINPQGKSALLVESATQLSLEDLAEPVAKLAGLRILTRYNIGKRSYYVIGMKLINLETGEASSIKLPEGQKFGFPAWSPDGRLFAAALYKPSGSEVWVFNPKTLSGQKISSARLNSVLPGPFWWSGDSKSIFVPQWLENRGAVPKAPLVPTGPDVQETAGSVSRVRTYQDLLKTDYDEKLFEYYCTCQIYKYDALTGEGVKFGPAGLITSFEASPDEQYFIVRIIERPYSKNLTAGRFAHRYEIWNSSGKVVKTLIHKPSGEEIPIEGVSVGLRSPFWQQLKPSTLCWAEALDGGNPNVKADFRDVLKALDEPFNAEPREIIRLPMRYSGTDKLNSPSQSLVWSYDRDKKWLKARLVDFNKTNTASECITVFSRNYNDHYNDEGNLVYQINKNGESSAILEDGKYIYLYGKGATPQGYRPFLRRHNIYTGKSEDVFVSGLEAFESLEDFAFSDLSAIVTGREDSSHPKNYCLRKITNHRAGETVYLTDFKPESQELASIKKELITYKRADGVPLSGMLYYPINYKPGIKYPAVIWAYPREYTDASTAGQVRSAANRYTRISGDSVLFFVLRGYVVLNNAEIPVVGDPLTANNTFVEQISAGAKAAVDKLVSLNIVDKSKIGIAGHSYGAFMVANLLAHTNLFAAGIARSGAYNRTLTPFGFQGERRTYWEAPEIYNRMSPFSYADKINEPILLIHGQDDSNPGTFTLQSQRLYSALKGHGATARLVLLPFEAHGYEARESILHVLAEMFEWFDRYVKRSSPEPKNKK